VREAVAVKQSEDGNRDECSGRSDLLAAADAGRPAAKRGDADANTCKKLLERDRFRK
jgi:hypothetical protein